MESFYKILGALVLLPILFWLAKPLLNNPKKIAILCFGNAVCLTFFTLAVLNRPEWIGIEQKEIANKLSKEKPDDALQFIEKNFLLIDNSFDKTTIKDTQRDPRDSASQVVTDQHKLTRLFDSLHKRINQIDLLVIDLALRNETSEDTILYRSLTPFYAARKLLLTADFTDKNDELFFHDDSAYADIHQDARENLLTSYSIGPPGSYGVPYRLYSFIDSVNTSRFLFFDNLLIERSRDDNWHFFQTTYLPQFAITNEEDLKQGRKINNEELEELRKPWVYYTLGQAVSPFMRKDIDEKILNRKREGKKNILFIGSFSSTTEDVHETLYGRLHGITILLNILVSLHEHQHYIGVPLICLLLAGYFLISLLLIRNHLKQYIWIEKIRSTVIRLKPSAEFTKRRPMMAFLGSMLYFILNFIFYEELPFTLLMVLIILVKFMTGYLINFYPILIYFGILRISFHHIKEIHHF